MISVKIIFGVTSRLDVFFVIIGHELVYAKLVIICDISSTFRSKQTVNKYVFMNISEQLPS